MATGTRSASDAAPSLPAVARDAPQRSLRLDDGTVVWLRCSQPAGVRDERAEVVADAIARPGVGRAAYRRVYGPRAVLTVALDEELWPAGLATALIAAIGAIAAAAGISTFLLRVSPTDERLLDVLAGEFAARCRRDGADVDVELDAAAWRRG